MNLDVFNFPNIKEAIRHSLTDWRHKLGRLSTDSLYVYLSSAALAPLVAAITQQQSPGISMELGVLLGSLGGNLMANVIQKFRDGADEAEMAEALQQILATKPELQADLDNLLAKLEVMTLARESLSETDKTWFVEQLQQEMTRLGNWPRFQAEVMAVGEGAKAYKVEDVETFVAGDVNITNISIITQEVANQFWGRLRKPEIDLRPATSQYLAFLVNKYRFLDFKGMGVSDRVPLRLPLLDMYVPLKARIEMPDGDTWTRELPLAGRLMSEWSRVGSNAVEWERQPCEASWRLRCRGGWG